MAMSLVPLVLALTAASPYFKIQVVDEDTGRGVPMVELRTVNHLLSVTDSNGLVAFNEPGLMRRKIYFHVRSHGYEIPADNFGFRGVALETKAGGTAEIKIKRLNIAERICRLTGEGIYRDSVLLGEPVPIEHPNINGRVLGQDSAQAIIHEGRMLWFWGDTDRDGYPLGNFRTTAAVATYPKGQTDASRGIEFRYLTRDDGFTREIFDTAEPGAVWISGLTSGGKGRMFAYYVRMKSLGEKLEQGYARWDEEKEQFKTAHRLPLEEPWRFLEGHTIQMREGNRDFTAGGFCFPVTRTASYTDAASYEAFTCLKEDGSVGAYRWQKALPPITPDQELELVRTGKLQKEKARFLPVDPADDTIVAHGGSVAWNPYRKRWIAFFTRKGGKDGFLSEIYYSEADAPTGPWTKAVKVLTHDKMTFYNPVHHPFLDAEGGRTVYFEGTYTVQFSGVTERTPRYEYNQILYRLDLSDPRLTSAR